MGWSEVPKRSILHRLHALRDFLTPPMTTAEREAALCLVGALIEEEGGMPATHAALPRSLTTQEVESS